MNTLLQTDYSLIFGGKSNKNASLCLYCSQEEAIYKLKYLNHVGILYNDELIKATEYINSLEHNYYVDVLAICHVYSNGIHQSYFSFYLS